MDRVTLKMLTSSISSTDPAPNPSSSFTADSNSPPSLRPHLQRGPCPSHSACRPAGPRTSPRASGPPPREEHTAATAPPWSGCPGRSLLWACTNSPNRAEDDRRARPAGFGTCSHTSAQPCSRGPQSPPRQPQRCPHPGPPAGAPGPRGSPPPPPPSASPCLWVYLHVHVHTHTHTHPPENLPPLRHQGTRPPCHRRPPQQGLLLRSPLEPTFPSLRAAPAVHRPPPWAIPLDLTALPPAFNRAPS